MARQERERGGGREKEGGGERNIQAYIVETRKRERERERGGGETFRHI